MDDTVNDGLVVWWRYWSTHTSALHKSKTTEKGREREKEGRNERRQFYVGYSALVFPSVRWIRLGFWLVNGTVFGIIVKDNVSDCFYFHGGGVVVVVAVFAAVFFSFVTRNKSFCVRFSTFCHWLTLKLISCVPHERFAFVFSCVYHQNILTVYK